MLSFIKGTIAASSEGQIVVEANNLGYVCNVANNVSSSVRLGQEVKVITHMVVREDDISLYGFLSNKDKELFLRLISVSGVGAKVALSILSGFSGDRLIEVLVLGDIATLSSIKGIGKKTAELIVLKLKDKITSEFNVDLSCTSSNIAAGVPLGAFNSTVNEAIVALSSLGYSKTEATRLVAAVGATATLSVEEIIVKALKA